jgi:succinoglycan biosynthesis transport protein ExoP
MTTLPQTTPLRLPRAGGHGALAVQQAPTGIIPATPGYQFTMGDLWRIVRSNLWVVIVLVMVTGTAGFFVERYLEKTDPVYRAQGILRIYPVQSSDPLHPSSNMADRATLEVQQATQVRLIKADTLIANVLKNKDTNRIGTTELFRTTAGGDVEKARERIEKNLSVNPEAATPQLIDVSFEASNPEDTIVLIDAIVDRAIQDDSDNNRSRTNVEYKAVQERQYKNKTDLEFIKGQIADLEAELIREGADPGGVLNTRMAIFGTLFQKQLTLGDNKNIANNMLTSFDDNVKAGITPIAVQRAVDDDRELELLSNQISNLEEEITNIKSSDVLGNSPVLRNMQNELGALQSRLDRQKEVKKADLIKTYRAELVAQQSGTQQQYDEAVKNVNEYQKKDAELSNKVDKLRALQEEKQIDQNFEVEATRKMTDLSGLINQTDTFGTMKWAAEPRKPEARVSPNLSTTMAGAIAVGLFLSIGIAFLREVTDTTVRSPRDIARVGQLNLLGMISHEQDDPQSSGVRLPLIIFEAPQSIMAEQLRQVRTRLQHTASLDTTRTLLITSPNPGDGKSTIAVNLAAGLALNGRRILLVDSNFRRPELHRIFGVGNDVGFSDALNDVGVFATAVRETPVPNLSVMASGPKPSNPTELIESQLMLDFIERALEEYDHVIFDSGPMLFVSESVALAPRVDGVVTVVRARTSSRGVLTRMRDMLRAVKAEHLGVILNGVRSQAGGYYAKNIQSYYRYQNAE